MKRMLSLLCVLALALALCVPAFADDATSGQVTEPPVGEVYNNSASTNGQVFNELAAETMRNPTVENGMQLAANVLANPSQCVNTNVIAAMRSVLTKEGQGEKQSVTTADGVAVTSYKQIGSGSVNITVLNVIENSFVLRGIVDGTQSQLGYYVEVVVPANMINGGSYMWVNDKNEFGEVISYVSNGNAYFSFYAPHFSDYSIMTRENTLKYLASLVPTQTSAASSPFARTDSNMNTMAVVVAAFVMGLAAVSAVALKKRSLSK